MEYLAMETENVPTKLDTAQDSWGTQAWTIDRGGWGPRKNRGRKSKFNF